MKTQRFGIEIEMTGITRREAAHVIAQYFTSQVNYQGGAYDEYRVLDNKGRTWKLVSDGSLTTMKKVQGRLITADKEYSVEPSGENRPEWPTWSDAARLRCQSYCGK